MRKMAYIYIVLAGLLWGTSGIFVNVLSPYGFDSFQLTEVRAVISVIFIGAFVFIKDKRLFKISLSELFIALLSGVGIFFTAGFYFYAMRATSVSTAVVLMYTAPVFVMAYSVAFLGEKLNKRKTLSVVIMLLGCVFVSGVIGGGKFNLEGITAGLLSSVAYSVYNIACKIQMKKKTNPLTANFYSFLFMLLTALITTNPVKIISVMSVNSSYIGILFVMMGIATCVLPYFFYSLSLRNLPVGTAASLGVVEPMSATLYGILFLNQIPDIYSFVGIVLILIAVVLLSMQKEQE